MSQAILTDPITWPDEAFIKELCLSDYEADFFREEYGRGLTYYLKRLDRLMFSGDKVLDAGCGVGQWSLALAQRFNQVQSVDINESRLASFQKILKGSSIQNVQVQKASITDLPFEENTFDAIFCYGVIMFTPIEQTLTEFHRILKPGGRVYLCLNAEGWYLSLLEQRELSTETQDYMRHILAKTVLERNGCALTSEVHRLQRHARKEIEQLLEKWGKKRHLPFATHLLAKSLKKSRVITECFSAFLQRAGQSGFLLMATLLLHTPKEQGFEKLLDLFQPHSLDKVHKRLKPHLTFYDPDRGIDPTRAYTPDDLSPILASVGFTDFQHTQESKLVCEASIQDITPIYEGEYKGLLSVWETVFAKPMAIPSLFAPEDHYQKAILARNAYPLWSTLSRPLLSNCTVSAENFQLLGGDAHIQTLVEQLVENSRTDEERLKAIVEFVQRSLFHHPLVQPVAPSGAIPDAYAILMGHIGRCGHAAQLLIDLLRRVDIEATLWQLPQHVTVKAKIEQAWVLAEADIFKNGVFPSNSNGSLLTLKDIQERPTRLDCFPPTGWFMQPKTRFSKDYWGQEVSGYTDAIAFHRRGFVSGYFSPEALGYPPSIPEGLNFSVFQDHFNLSWKPATGKDLIGYRVAIGTQSRQWSYDDPGSQDEILDGTSKDVLSTETTKTQITGEVPFGVSKLYASVTAISRRIEREPETFFWPSEEVAGAR